MSAKIEIHMLQSFPPANLNRDDTNTPKDCEFGGVRRARISSQCIKRSIRWHPDFARLTGVEPAKRTRLLASQISDGLIQAGKPVEESKKVGLAFTDSLLGGMDEKAPEKSKVLFFISEVEKKEIVQRLIADWEKSINESQIVENTEDKKRKKGEGKKFGDLIKEYQKAFANRSSAPDIAMFGRMLAEDPKLNLNAACQVAHAISTHKVNMQTDYFTAVDDLQPDSESGAGMIGVTSFNSAVFYRYSSIDWEQLIKNLDGNKELAQRTVMAFLDSAIKAVPSGKQNNFAALTTPGLVFVVLRPDGQAWSLVNAFERPIDADKEGGILESSKKALIHKWQCLNKIYGNPELPAQTFLLSEDDSLSLAPFTSENSLADLEQKVLAALKEI